MKVSQHVSDCPVGLTGRSNSKEDFMFVLPHSTTVPLLSLKLDLDYFLSSPT